MHAAMAGATGGNLNDLLDDFNALFDTEWTFLAMLCSIMISSVGILVSSIFVRAIALAASRPTPATH